MDLKQFNNNLKRMSLRLGEESILYFEDEDRNDYFVENVSIVNDKMCLHLGDDSDINIKDLLNKLKNETRLLHVFAKCCDTKKKYEIDNDWFTDDDNNAYMNLIAVGDKDNIGEALLYQKEFKDEYNDESVFGSKITSIAKKMGVKLVYVAYWLYYSLKYGKLSAKSIAIVTGAIGYLICPIDLISDMLPIIGFTDDAAVLVAAYFAIISSMSPDLVKKITQMAKNSVKSIFGYFSEDDIKL